LEVSPTVSADNLTVNLDLSVEFSEFLGFIDYGSPIQSPTPTTTGIETSTIQNQILLPVFDTIRETTNVSAYDGQTIAIGGLFGHQVTDVQDKIPFAGDLPALGILGRSASEVHEKSMLSIFLTVRLVDPGNQPINPDKEIMEEPNLPPAYEPQVPETAAPPQRNRLLGSFPK